MDERFLIATERRLVFRVEIKSKDSGMPHHRENTRQLHCVKFVKMKSFHPRKLAREFRCTYLFPSKFFFIDEVIPLCQSKGVDGQ